MDKSFRGLRDRWSFPGGAGTASRGGAQVEMTFFEQRARVCPGSQCYEASSAPGAA